MGISSQTHSMLRAKVLLEAWNESGMIFPIRYEGVHPPYNAFAGAKRQQVRAAREGKRSETVIPDAPD